MKSCDWCLWLGDEKVFDIRKLRENFDTVLLVGYYLGGGLSRWLKDAGEDAVLEKVRQIDKNKDIGAQLEFIFGVRPDKKSTAEPLYSDIIQAAEYHEVSESVKLAVVAANENPSSFSSSFNAGSGSFSERSLRKSNTVSSFGTGSFRMGSFRSGAGSFRGSSFRSGSFRLIKTSFNKGSFHTGSFMMGSGGSFCFYMGKTEITKEEYRRTKINLSSCPLNSYGYGIHKI